MWVFCFVRFKLRSVGGLSAGEVGCGLGGCGLCVGSGLGLQVTGEWLRLF